MTATYPAFVDAGAPDQFERQRQRELLMREDGFARAMKRLKFFRESSLASRTHSGRDLLTDHLGDYVEAVRSAYFKPTNRLTDVAKLLRLAQLTAERIGAAALQTILDRIFEEPVLIAAAREVGRAVYIEALAHYVEVADLDAWPAVAPHFKLLRDRSRHDEIIELLVEAADHFGLGAPQWTERQQAEVGASLLELAIAATPLFERFQPPHPKTGEL